jgi:hypothetical protein
MNMILNKKRLMAMNYFHQHKKTRLSFDGAYNQKSNSLSEEAKTQ